MESGGVGGRVYNNSRLTNVLLKNECTPEALDSLWLPNSSSSPSFHGSMVNFEEATATERETPTPFFTQIDPKLEKCSEDIYEGCFPPAEKKRRLSPEQVQFLEKSFEVENKLEPERKVQLAKELGLQPRQVAIWFQNRRARYKTKLLEKEYDCLKSSYDKLKADYESLYKESEKTKNEVNLLTEKLLLREKGQDPKPKRKPEPSDDPISPLDLLQPKKKVLSSTTDAASSAKSDIVDSDSPRHCGGTHEPTADSSNAFESDFSQEEDDSPSRRRRLDQVPPLGLFPAKMEAAEYYDDDLQPNSCNLGFPVQDQGTWFWQ